MLTVFGEEHLFIWKKNAERAGAADWEQLVDGTCASVNQGILAGEASAYFLVTPDERSRLIGNAELLRKRRNKTRLAEF